jgi:hypothetical protein
LASHFKNDAIQTDFSRLFVYGVNLKTSHFTLLNPNISLKQIHYNICLCTTHPLITSAKGIEFFVTPQPFPWRRSMHILCSGCILFRARDINTGERGRYALHAISYMHALAHKGSYPCTRRRIFFTSMLCALMCAVLCNTHTHTRRLYSHKGEAVAQ